MNFLTDKPRSGRPHKSTAKHIHIDKMIKRKSIADVKKTAIFLENNKKKIFVNWNTISRSKGYKTYRMLVHKN